MIRSAVWASAIALGLAFGPPAVPARAAGADVPAPGASKRIDDIKARGVLKVAVIGEFPWLKENTSGSGEPFEGPAWFLANEYAKRLGVKLETVAVSHETKVPILATGQADISIAPLSVTEARKKVVDFVVYSKSTLCLFGKADNPKLAKADSVDDLNTPDITIAYFTGTPPETWLPTRLPKAVRQGRAGLGRQRAGRRDHVGPRRCRADRHRRLGRHRQEGAGPRLLPEGRRMPESGEFPTEVGMAVDKNQPEFLAWLNAVYDEVKDKVAAEELASSRIRGRRPVPPGTGPPSVRRPGTTAPP